MAVWAEQQKYARFLGQPSTCLNCQRLKAGRELWLTPVDLPLEQRGKEGACCDQISKWLHMKLVRNAKKSLHGDTISWVYEIVRYFPLEISLPQPHRMRFHGKISQTKIAFTTFASSTTVQEGRERIVIAFFSWSPRVSFKNVFEAFEIQRLYCQKMLFPAQKGPCLTHFPSRTAFTESISW